MVFRVDHGRHTKSTGSGKDVQNFSIGQLFQVQYRRCDVVIQHISQILYKIFLSKASKKEDAP